MKIIFIKDDRLREITHDRSNKLTEMLISGRVEGPYTIRESSKEYEDGIYFGYDIVDSERSWVLKERAKVREHLTGVMKLNPPKSTKVLVQALAYCSECDWRECDVLIAAKEGRKHARKTGHKVTARTDFVRIYNEKFL